MSAQTAAAEAAAAAAAAVSDTMNRARLAVLANKAEPCRPPRLACCRLLF